MQNESPTEPAELAAGVSVLIVGFRTLDCDDVGHVREWPAVPPSVVHAGFLSERYVPGLAVLLAPGPIAASISPKGVRSTWAYRDPKNRGSLVFYLRLWKPDERRMMAYLVLEDRERISELVGGSGPQDWPRHLSLADGIRSRARDAWERFIAPRPLPPQPPPPPVGVRFD